MNNVNKCIAFIIIAFVFQSCVTRPAVMNETQTEIADTIKQLEESIPEVKMITDESKNTGEIKKADVVTVIKYVEKSEQVIAKLKRLEETQAKNIAKVEQKNIDAEKKIDKYRKYLVYSVAMNIVLASFTLLVLYTKIKKLFTFVKR